MRTIKKLITFLMTMDDLAYLLEINLYDRNEFLSRFAELIAEYKAIK